MFLILFYLSRNCLCKRYCSTSSQVSASTKAIASGHSETRTHGSESQSESKKSVLHVYIKQYKVQDLEISALRVL